jgi:DNA-binding SARP family transcriptional activator
MALELRLFGTLRLAASDGRDLESLLRQPKRAALLAYLAAASPRGFHRRDALLAVFWPELDDTHARAALNQALYVLRNALGDQAIRTRGDEIGLNADLVRCDVVTFEAALDAARPADALAVYDGDLLEGFYVPDAAQFEHWLDTERTRLRLRASDGAWALAESKAAASNAIEAARWARRAADLVPADEATMRRLMSFLARLGDRGAALRAYEAFAWRLTSEYELEPSAETQALALALREGGKPADVRVVDTTPRSATILVAVRRRMSPAAIAASFIVFSGVATAGWAWLRPFSPSPPSIVRFALEFPDSRLVTGGVAGSTIAVAPGGSWLAYVAAHDSGRHLVLRAMDRLESVPVRNTRGAYLPFFSPDGEWLGFVAEGKIQKVALDGGPAIVVCAPGETVFGATWSSADEIIFATAGGLWVAPAGGGNARVLAASDTSTGYRFPEALPNGLAVVFTVVTDSGFHLATISLRTREIRPLGVRGTNPHFVVPGMLAFTRPDGVLLAAPFEERTLKLSGSAVPVVEGVAVGVHGGAKLGISPSGALAYAPDIFGGRRLVLVHRDGTIDTLPGVPQGYHGVRFSRDGRRLLVTIERSQGPEVWMHDLDRGTFTRVTSDGSSYQPDWVPNESRIVMGTASRGRLPGFAIHSISAVSYDSVEVLRASEHGQLPLSFTPDGSMLLIQRTHPETQADIWTMSLDESHRVQAIAPHLLRRAIRTGFARWKALGVHVQ